MKKILFLFIIFALLSPLNVYGSEIEQINLPVPFIPEVHDNNWSPPWNNACEEAAIAMVSLYYQDIKEISIEKARAIMTPLFKIQDQLFGSHQDTDAERTAKLANHEMFFYAQVKNNPTIDDIKDQIRKGNPVITTHYGFGLKNSTHRFRRGGSSYHVVVVSGFDDKTKEFITQDSGTPTGKNYRYNYDLFMDSIHDFDHKNGLADGPPRAIFTVRQMLVKPDNSSKIYYILNETKHYISHPELFKKFNWQWKNVKKIKPEFLNNYSQGLMIDFTTSMESLNLASKINNVHEKIIKAEGSNRIFLYKNNSKHYITHPNLFKVYGWSWNKVEIVSKNWLESLPNGPAITE